MLSDDGVLTISGAGEMRYEGASSPWAAYRSKIKRAVIARGVTCIAARAFANCGNMASISIPYSVVRIEEDAFDGCNGLTVYGYPYSRA
ncbi:MAG: leucine-rich repeat protein [Clostridia bacterium]|nr:leucine-rich repeat protein [Clostridia bacterium]